MLNSTSFDFCYHTVNSNLVGITFHLIEKIRFRCRLHFVGNTKLPLSLDNLFPRDYLCFLHAAHTVILIQHDVVEMTIVLEQFRPTEILRLCVKLYDHCILTFSTWFNYILYHSVTSPTRRFRLTLGKLRSVTASRLYFNQMLLLFASCVKQKRLKRLVEIVTESLIVDDFIINISTHAILVMYGLLCAYYFTRFAQKVA